MTLSILHFQQLANAHFVAHQDEQDRQDKKDKVYAIFSEKQEDKPYPAYPAHPVFIVLAYNKTCLKRKVADASQGHNQQT